MLHNGNHVVQLRCWTSWMSSLRHSYLLPLWFTVGIDLDLLMFFCDLLENILWLCAHAKSVVHNLFVKSSAFPMADVDIQSENKNVHKVAFGVPQWFHLFWQYVSIMHAAMSKPIEFSLYIRVASRYFYVCIVGSIRSQNTIRLWDICDNNLQAIWFQKAAINSAS